MSFLVRQRRRILAISLVLGVMAADAPAQNLLAPVELKEAARAILGSEKSSVVWVTAKVRLRRNDDGSAIPGEEGGLAVLGTVVGQAGLTVVSNTDFDPARTLREGRDEASPEFSFIEIVLENGVKVPANVVYRDAELDLAFLKPDESIAKQRGAVFRAVKTDGGHSLEVMDDVILLSRLNESMEWAPSVVLGNVSAVVRGSRTYYLSSAKPEAGTPVYASDGSLLGIGVYRIFEGQVLDLVTLSSETVHVISEIAEATGFLTERSEEIGTSLTEGLTLSLSDLKARPTAGDGDAKVTVPEATAEKKPVEIGVNASEPLPSPAGATTSVRPPMPPMMPRDPAPDAAEIAKAAADAALATPPAPVAAPAAPKPKPVSKPISKPISKPSPKPAASAVRTASQRPPVPVDATDSGEAEAEMEVIGAEDKEKKKGALKRLFGGLKLQSTAEKRKGKDAEEDLPEETTLEREEAVVEP